ncbi:MAG TPA: class E sortase [Candidatus Saccharimonadales bacterium]|nr:class E sortase [Candidatus Saccharimonadales bacterium]
MLHIDKPRHFPVKGLIVTIVALLFVIVGAYILLLVLTPNIPFLYSSQPLNVKAMGSPKVGVNKIMIPGIGVDIPYGSNGQASLDSGAWWRYPERGDPAKGGNFVIAAHRFSIQPTPRETAIKSPFYHLDKVKVGDPIIVDFQGKRYGYKISKAYTVKPSQTEIEAQTDKPKMTLYSCELGGSSAGRTVFDAEPMGEITVQ